MGDNASLLRLEDQPPVIRLIFSLLFTVVTGTIIFWLFVYCGTLLFGISASEILVIPGQGAVERQVDILRYVQVSQQIGLFLIPSVFLAILLRRGNDSFLMMNRAPGLFTLIFISALVVFIIPVITWTGIVNSQMVLPEGLTGIERLMREKEERASYIMGFLLGQGGIHGLCVNLLTLALIPAFAEELLFRGVLQQLLIKVFRSSQAGIWFTAILFSAIHFQFFGFLPRMILGLLFGYLFLWTGSLWSAIIPHFLNNAIPVVLTFLSGRNRGMIQMGEEKSVFPFIHIIISALILYYLWYLNQKRGRY
jgi:membrane protease YdiL (CAAX protease family)